MNTDTVLENITTNKKENITTYGDTANNKKVLK